LQWLTKEPLRKQISKILNTFYLRFETGTQTERTFVHQSVESMMKYIQENSVRAGILEKPEYYMCTGAKNYAGLEIWIAVDFGN
jgi:ATP-dependent protease HslVU (ClpYQ) ATPase subunit